MPQLGHHRRRLDPLGDIGGHRDHALAVPALDVAGLRPGHAFEEMAHRHHAVGRRDPQTVECQDAPLLWRKAQADVDVVIGIVGPVAPDKRTVCYELDEAADGGDVCAETPRLLAIDLEPPFDAGHGAGVVDVDEAGHAFHLRAQALHRVLDGGRVVPDHPHLHRLALHGAALLLHEFGADAGKPLEPLADLRLDLRGRPALAPVGQQQRDAPDGVLRPPRAGSDAGVDVVHPVDALKPAFHLAHEAVHLGDREIAAGMHIDPRPVRLAVREEDLALVVEGIERVDADEHEEGRTRHQPGPPDDARERARIHAGEPLETLGIEGALA